MIYEIVMVISLDNFWYSILLVLWLFQIAFFVFPPPIGCIRGCLLVVCFLSDSTLSPPFFCFFRIAPEAIRKAKKKEMWYVRTIRTVALPHSFWLFRITSEA
jgi:hypothetical protein